jgi:hypothetical protein
MKFKAGDMLISKNVRLLTRLQILEVSSKSYRTVYDDGSKGGLDHDFYETYYELDIESMKKVQWDKEMKEICSQ